MLFIQSSESPRISGLFVWHIWQQKKLSLTLFSSLFLSLSLSPCKFIHTSELCLEVGYGCTVTSRGSVFFGSHISRQLMCTTQKAGFCTQASTRLSQGHLCWTESKAMEVQEVPPSPRQQEHRPLDEYDDGKWMVTKVLIENFDWKVMWNIRKQKGRNELI